MAVALAPDAGAAAGDIGKAGPGSHLSESLRDSHDTGDGMPDIKSPAFMLYTSACRRSPAFICKQGHPNDGDDGSVDGADDGLLLEQPGAPSPPTGVDQEPWSLGGAAGPPRIPGIPGSAATLARTCSSARLGKSEFDLAKEVLDKAPPGMSTDRPAPAKPRSCGPRGILGSRCKNSGFSVDPVASDRWIRWRR
eukprot:gene15761-biopygen6693